MKFTELSLVTHNVRVQRQSKEAVLVRMHG